MVATEEVWMPREIHNYDRGSTYRNDGELEWKSRNRSVLHTGSSKAVYWSPRSSPSSYQQCSTKLSEIWGMAS